MKLLRLSARWFRQHVDTSVDFQRGLTAIVGPNGAGKTTLVEAIAFALFGSRVIRGKTEHLRTRGAGGDARTEVALLFEHEGMTWRVVRSLTDARLYAGGEGSAVVEGLTDVTARVNLILGMNYEEFIATYFTEQKGLEFLSGRKGAAERERFIVRMMGYDRLERVQDALRRDRRDRRAEVAGAEAALGQRERIVERLSAERGGLAALVARLAESTSALERGEQEAAAAEQTLAALEQERQPWLAATERIAAARVRLEEKTRRRAVLEERRGRLVALVGDTAAAAANEAGGGPLLDELRRELEGARRLVQEEEARFRERVAGAEAGIRALADQLAAVGRRREASRSLGAASLCPTCNQALGAAFAEVRAQVELEHARIADVLAAAQAEAAAIGTPGAELVAARARLAEITAAEAAGERRVREEEGAREARADLRRVIEEQVEVAGEIAAAEESLQNLERARQEIRFSEDAYARARGAAEAARRLVEVSRLQRVRAEGELEKHRALVVRTEGELRAWDERSAGLIRLKREVLLLEESDGVLTEFRKYLNAGIRPRLAELASEFLADLTDGRYTAVEIGEDFAPTVLDDGEPKPVISGGEEDILNLCLRLALSSMLAERAGHTFSLLMLDEVFGSLDDNRRMNVLALLERLSLRFEQILVITHLEDIKDGVEHLLEVSYDEHGVAVAGAPGDQAERDPAPLP